MMLAVFDFFYDGRFQLMGLLTFAFQLWMAIDAARRQDWIWAAFNFFFIFSAILYLFLVFLPSRGTAGSGGGGGGGFELPGAASRKRIQELKSQIHHLDKAHHHMELGDVHMRRGKPEEAEASYRAAFERDPEDIDIRSRMGRILMTKEPERAREFLEQVCAENAHHDYGGTLMCLAEIYRKLGRADDSIKAWEMVLGKNAYARAKVQLAELLLERGEKDRAHNLLKEAISEHEFAPKFAKASEKTWIKRAKGLLGNG